MDKSKLGEVPSQRSEGGKESGCTLLLRGVCHRTPARGRVAHSPFSNIDHFKGSGKHCSKCSFRADPDGLCWDLAKVPDTPLLSPSPQEGFYFAAVSRPAAARQRGSL